MKGLSSEILKYKRTFMGKLIVFIPLFFAVYALVVSVIMQNPMAEANGNNSIGWAKILTLVFNWWPFLFLPLGYALFAVLVAAQEKKAGNYRALRSHDVSPAMLWIHKIAGMAIYGLLSTLVLTIAVSTAGLVTAAGPFPIGKILAGGMTCWLASLVLIPIQLWAATLGGTFLSMGMGFGGMILGIIAAPTYLWIVCPWSFATRLMCPMIGIHPNGTVLSAGDPLLSASVVPVGIVVSLIAVVVFTLLTSVWFAKREVS